jgi:hypothetical protein
VGTRVGGWIWRGRTNGRYLFLQGTHAVTDKNGYVHEGRIDRFKLPHTTAAAYGTCEHELNMTAMQTSEVDPHQPNGGCVRFGSLGHNKLVNAWTSDSGVTTNWWMRELRILGSQQIGECVNFGYWGHNKTSETGDILTTKWRMCEHRKLEATNK